MTHNHKQRRKHLQALLALLLCSACSKHTPGSEQAQAERLGLSEEDQALQHRFRGISKGGELRVSATYATDMRQMVYQPNGKLFGPLLGHLGRKGGRTGYFGDEKYGLPLPKYLRYQRFSKDIPKKMGGGYWFRQRYDGPPEVDVIVPVATRIPDEVLDRIRKYKGGLILKLRLTPETILVGWEIAGMKDFPHKIDNFGKTIITDDDLMIGGDFCEKQVYTGYINGKAHRIVQQGWQIDPKTGKKIEMDY